MKIFGKLRCKALGCGPHTRHRLDADLDLYVCDSCGAGVMDAPAREEEQWCRARRDENGKLLLPVGPNHAGHVWYCQERDQARVRL